MSKFKIGDVVRAKDDSYPYTNLRNAWVGIVIYTWKNGTFSAETVSSNDFSQIGEVFKGLFESDFEVISSDKVKEIRLKQLDNTVIAIMDNGDGTTKTLKVEPVEKDKFDFRFAARMAIVELFEESDFSPKLMLGTKCMGVIGEPTNLKDRFGNPLKVGDIVAYTPKYLDVSEIDISLDFVVKGNSEPFVMGIRGDCEYNGEIVDWDVVKFKDCYEVKHGEQLSGIVAKLHAD